MSKKGWSCESESQLLQTPIMSLVKKSCRLHASASHTEKTHDFFVLRSRDWCNIIPVTSQGEVVLVRQYRVGVGEYTLEIPGGVWDPGDPDARSAAIREMSEETGYVPLPEARCEDLGWCFSNPAILDNRTHTFIVGPVARQKEQQLDGTEAIEVEAVPISEIPALIRTGKIRHALMLNTFLFLALRDDRASEALIEQLKTFLTGKPPA